MAPPAPPSLRRSPSPVADGRPARSGREPHRAPPPAIGYSTTAATGGVAPPARPLSTAATARCGGRLANGHSVSCIWPMEKLCRMLLANGICGLKFGQSTGGTVDAEYVDADEPERHVGARRVKYPHRRGARGQRPGQMQGRLRRGGREDERGDGRAPWPRGWEHLAGARTGELSQQCGSALHAVTQMGGGVCARAGPRRSLMREAPYKSVVTCGEAGQHAR